MYTTFYYRMIFCLAYERKYKIRQLLKIESPMVGLLQILYMF